MPTNWERIKREYIYGDESYPELSARSNVSCSTLKKIAAKEGWTAARARYRTDLALETNRKTVEKTADAESDIAASKARIRRNIIEQIETRLLEKELDTGDFRRLVQCYKDMEDIDVGRTEATESEAFEKLLEFVGGSDET